MSFPASLLSSTSPLHSDVLCLPPLCGADVPDDVFKEAVAAFVGRASTTQTHDTLASYKGVEGGVVFLFSAAFDASAFSAVASELSQLMAKRGFPRLDWSLGDDPAFPNCQLIVDSASEWQQRVGVRYNSALELQLATIVSRMSDTSSSTSAEWNEGGTQATKNSSSSCSSSLPTLSVLVTGRRLIGPRRVFDLQVDPALHSFVANGVLAHNCDHFDQHHPNTWKCVWKRRCAHAHGKADLKSKEVATEEWKTHLAAVGPAVTQRRPSVHLPPTLQPPSPHTAALQDGEEDGEPHSTNPHPTVTTRVEPHITRRGFRHRTEAPQRGVPSPQGPGGQLPSRSAAASLVPPSSWCSAPSSAEQSSGLSPYKAHSRRVSRSTPQPLAPSPRFPSRSRLPSVSLCVLFSGCRCST